MSRQLPSFPSLRAFEAAARHLSFKKAAEELCLTQSAISHQVKFLEEFLGAPLFIRHSQSIELTLRGSEYQAMVSHLIDGLETATQKFKGGDLSGSLYVQASPSFATYWLIPRILRFNRIYPDIELNLSTIEQSDVSTLHPFDIRVNCSWEVPEDCGGEPLMSSLHVPVCSPELLEGGPAITRPEDILQYPILREVDSWSVWGIWFDQAGFEEPPGLAGPRFENAYLTLKAAEEGQGIALAPIALIAEKIALGRLIVLIDLRVARELYFTITCIKNWKRQPRIVAFREWLHSELGDCSELYSSSDEGGTIAR